jgi:hypothetical protein
LRRLAAQHPAVASVAYIDDVHIVGHLHEVVAAVRTLTSGLSECGLETNAKKCVISLSSLGGLKVKTPPLWVSNRVLLRWSLLTALLWCRTRSRPSMRMTPTSCGFWGVAHRKPPSRVSCRFRALLLRLIRLLSPR